MYFWWWHFSWIAQPPPPPLMFLFGEWHRRRFLQSLVAFRQYQYDTIVLEKVVLLWNENVWLLPWVVCVCVCFYVYMLTWLFVVEGSTYLFFTSTNATQLSSCVQCQTSKVLLWNVLACKEWRGMEVCPWLNCKEKRWGSLHNIPFDLTMFNTTGRNP